MYLPCDPLPCQAVEAQFQREFADIQAKLLHYSQHVRPLLTRLETLPSWSDVRVFSFYSGGPLSLFLASKHKDSTLVREIAFEFEVTGVKQADDSSLSVTFAMTPIAIEVLGYVPASCAIVEVEEWVATVPGHSRTVRKVVGGD